MAGIGFTLRRLSRQDNLLGLVQAYTHSALASTGPWLFTVFALGTIILMASKFVSSETILHFRVILIYNFAFSLVLTGPVAMITTRYIADSFHRKDVSSVPAVLIVALLLVMVTQLPLLAAFYGTYMQWPLMLKLSACANFMLISTIWVVSVFLSAIKDYKSITLAFVAGMVVAVVAAAALSAPFQTIGLLNGVSLGLLTINAIMLGRIFAEYPYGFSLPRDYFSYFSKYWELAIGGFIYNAAIWADKWIMWFAPGSLSVEGMRMYPHYDGAMFMAFLTIVPSLSLFLFSMETNFFEHYLRFYRDIQQKVTLAKIEKNHQTLMLSLFGSFRNFIVLQGGITVLALLAAPKIITFTGSHYLQIGMFRFGVLGAFCHVFTMLLLIILSYFDNRRAVLFIQSFFLLTMIIFTLITAQLGFPYYGYGYLLSSLLTFIVAAIVCVRYVVKLPYHSFITSNSSI